MNQRSTMTFMTQAELDFYKHKTEDGRPIRWPQNSTARPLAQPNTKGNSQRADWYAAVQRAEFAYFGEVRQ